MKAWFLLFRPWSYTATVIPFLVVAAVSAGATDAAWGHWWGGLAAAFFFQATVNLLNTWGDERSGVDDVPGAIRTTPQVHDGAVSMRAVLAAGLTCAALAGALGVALCFHRAGGVWRLNVPLLVAGFIGFLGATNYSTGIRFKYRGLGVPFVAFLMGPLEMFVAWSLLFPGRVPSGAAAAFGLLLSLPVAAQVCVILHGNDMRDMPSDRLAGIRSTALALGPRGALAFYVAAHVLPYAVTLGLFLAPLCRGALAPAFLLPFLALPFSLKTLRTACGVYRLNPAAPPWRGLERGSGKVHFLFGLLYSLALNLSG